MQVTEKLLDRVVDEIIDKIPPFLSGSVYTLDWWASGSPAACAGHSEMRDSQTDALQSCQTMVNLLILFI